MESASSLGSMYFGLRIATKWRQHLAVGVSPQFKTHQVSLATEWRQQFQLLLSPLRGFDCVVLIILGADAPS